uniref:mucin-3A-like n=1 Tax=Styela clava TaxID=7725 RepID=UPI001939E0B9|nr:mucin-3A-like [Styela clava]
MGHTSSGFIFGYYFYFLLLLGVCNSQDIPTTVIGSCGGRITGSSSGYIASPGYPSENYPDSSNCSYLIEADEGNIITYRTLLLDLEARDAQADECYDYVQLYDGDILLGSALNSGSYCGNDKIPLNATTGNTLRIEFISDEITNGKGFVIQWTALNPADRTPTLDCNFDGATPLCPGWTQSTEDLGDWQFSRTKTATSLTGPSEDHTEDTTDGRYAYIEASDMDEGEEAIIISPKIEKSDSKYCLSFWYHMFGSGTGQLAVIKLAFRATRGKSFYSDMAIDDITILSEACASQQTTESSVTEAEFTTDFYVTTADTISNCTEEDFICSDGFDCIKKEYVCDGDLDCSDGSDELNCPAPARCPETFEWKSCGSACNRTCADGEDGPTCSLRCVQRCDCPFDAPVLHNGRCIPYDQCPSTSIPLEEVQIASLGEITKTSVTVTFDTVSSAESFIVSLVIPDLPDSEKKTQTLNNDRATISYTFTGLTQGTEYQIFIESVATGKENVLSSVLLTFTTLTNLGRLTTTPSEEQTTGYYETTEAIDVTEKETAPAPTTTTSSSGDETTFAGTGVYETTEEQFVVVEDKTTQSPPTPASESTDETTFPDINVTTDSEVEKVTTTPKTTTEETFIDEETTAVLYETTAAEVIEDTTAAPIATTTTIPVTTKISDEETTEFDATTELVDEETTATTTTTTVPNTTEIPDEGTTEFDFETTAEDVVVETTATVPPTTTTTTTPVTTESINEETTEFDETTESVVEETTATTTTTITAPTTNETPDEATTEFDFETTVDDIVVETTATVPTYNKQRLLSLTESIDEETTESDVTTESEKDETTATTTVTTTEIPEELTTEFDFETTVEDIVVETTATVPPTTTTTTTATPVTTESIIEETTESEEETTDSTTTTVPTTTEIPDEATTESDFETTESDVEETTVVLTTTTTTTPATTDSVNEETTVPDETTESPVEETTVTTTTTAIPPTTTEIPDEITTSTSDINDDTTAATTTTSTTTATTISLTQPDETTEKEFTTKSSLTTEADETTQTTTTTTQATTTTPSSIETTGSESETTEYFTLPDEDKKTTKEVGTTAQSTTTTVLPSTTLKPEETNSFFKTLEIGESITITSEVSESGHYNKNYTKLYNFVVADDYIVRVTFTKLNMYCDDGIHFFDEFFFGDEFMNVCGLEDLRIPNYRLPIVYSHSEMMTMVFQTNHENESVGFEAVIDSVPSNTFPNAACGTKITDTSGQIASPNFPAVSEMKDCEFEFDLSERQYVEFNTNFIGLARNETEGLCEDNTLVFVSSDEETIVSCGIMRSPLITLTGNIKITANTVGQQPGFLISYGVKECFADGQKYSKVARSCDDSCSNDVHVRCLEESERSARCACPPEKPILYLGRCISIDECEIPSTTSFATEVTDYAISTGAQSFETTTSNVLQQTPVPETTQELVVEAVTLGTTVSTGGVDEKLVEDTTISEPNVTTESDFTTEGSADIEEITSTTSTVQVPETTEFKTITDSDKTTTQFTAVTGTQKPAATATSSGDDATTTDAHETTEIETTESEFTTVESVTEPTTTQAATTATIVKETTEPSETTGFETTESDFTTVESVVELTTTQATTATTTAKETTEPFETTESEFTTAESVIELTTTQATTATTTAKETTEPFETTESEFTTAESVVKPTTTQATTATTAKETTEPFETTEFETTESEFTTAESVIEPTTTQATTATTTAKETTESSETTEFETTQSEFTTAESVVGSTTTQATTATTAKETTEPFETTESEFTTAESVVEPTTTQVTKATTLTETTEPSETTGFETTESEFTTAESVVDPTTTQATTTTVVKETTEPFETTESEFTTAESVVEPATTQATTATTAKETTEPFETTESEFTTAESVVEPTTTQATTTTIAKKTTEPFETTEFETTESEFTTAESVVEPTTTQAKTATTTAKETTEPSETTEFETTQSEFTTAESVVVSTTPSTQATTTTTPKETTEPFETTEFETTESEFTTAESVVEPTTTQATTTTVVKETTESVETTKLETTESYITSPESSTPVTTTQSKATTTQPNVGVVGPTTMKLEETTQLDSTTEGATMKSTKNTYPFNEFAIVSTTHNEVCFQFESLYVRVYLVFYFPEQGGDVQLVEINSSPDTKIYKKCIDSLTPDTAYKLQVGYDEAGTYVHHTVIFSTLKKFEVETAMVLNNMACIKLANTTKNRTYEIEITVTNSSDVIRKETVISKNHHINKCFYNLEPGASYTFATYMATDNGSSSMGSVHFQTKATTKTVQIYEQTQENKEWRERYYTWRSSFKDWFDYFNEYMYDIGATFTDDTNCPVQLHKPPCKDGQLTPITDANGCFLLLCKSSDYEGEFTDEDILGWEEEYKLFSDYFMPQWEKVFKQYTAQLIDDEKDV